MFLTNIINKMFRGKRDDAVETPRVTPVPDAPQPEPYARLRSELSQTNLRLDTACTKAHRLGQAAYARRSRIPRVSEASHA